MIKYTVIVSDLAAKEFSNHLAFLANVSKPAAVDLKKRMVEALRKLETMPNRFFKSRMSRITSIINCLFKTGTSFYIRCGMNAFM